MNNITSLFNFINLYLKNEAKDKKVILNIINLEEEIEFRIWFNTYDDGYSSMKLKKDIISNDDINYLMDLYRDDVHYKEENYNYDKEKKTYNYSVCLSNNRLLYLTNFTLSELNNYRNILLNIKDEKLMIKSNKKSSKKVVKKNNILQEDGYSNYAGIVSLLFIMALFVLIAYILYESLY